MNATDTNLEMECRRSVTGFHAGFKPCLKRLEAQRIYLQIRTAALRGVTRIQKEKPWVGHRDY